MLMILISIAASAFIVRLVVKTSANQKVSPSMRYGIVILGVLVASFIGLFTGMGCSEGLWSSTQRGKIYTIEYLTREGDIVCGLLRSVDNGRLSYVHFFQEQTFGLKKGGSYIARGITARERILEPLVAPDK